MKYEVNFNGKVAKVEFSNELTSEELNIVVDTLTKCVVNQQKNLKKAEATKLDIYDRFDKMYPPLSIRAENILKRAGKTTIKDVLDCTPTEILCIRNMGKKTADEVMERFREYGVFKEDKVDSEGEE